VRRNLLEWLALPVALFLNWQHPKRRPLLIAGAVLFLIACLLPQLDKLRSSSLSFSLLNAAGSLLIIVSLLFKFNCQRF
jgi:hypothetical protein